MAYIKAGKRRADARLVWASGGAAMLLAALNGGVLAADVRGQLVLGSYHAPEAAKPPRPAYNWEIENGVKEIARDRSAAQRELAVVLVGEGAPDGPDGPDRPDRPDHVEVAISGGALLPSTICVRTGTTVRIRNDDEIGHEIYAEGLDGFSPEATSPKAIRSVNLQKAGTWPLLDRLAPHARGQLHVLPDLIASAKLEASGNYVFSDVAPGKYTLKVFHGADVLASKDVEVGERTLTVDPLTLAGAPATQ